jgi:methionine aminopeptidase
MQLKKYLLHEVRDIDNLRKDVDAWVVSALLVYMDINILKRAVNDVMVHGRPLILSLKEWDVVTIDLSKR